MILHILVWESRTVPRLSFEARQTGGLLFLSAPDLPGTTLSSASPAPQAFLPARRSLVFFPPSVRPCFQGDFLQGKADFLLPEPFRRPPSFMRRKPPGTLSLSAPFPLAAEPEASGAPVAFPRPETADAGKPRFCLREALLRFLRTKRTVSASVEAFLLHHLLPCLSVGLPPDAPKSSKESAFIRMKGRPEDRDPPGGALQNFRSGESSPFASWEEASRLFPAAPFSFFFPLSCRFPEAARGKVQRRGWRQPGRSSGCRVRGNAVPLLQREGKKM